MNKFTKKKFFSGLFLIICFAVVILHYGYLYSLPPLLRNAYEHRNIYPQGTSRWALDATSDATDFFKIGMSEKDALAVIAQSGLELSKNTSRTPKQVKMFDKHISAYQNIRAGFAGMAILYGVSYTYVVSLDFNDDKLDQIRATLIINTL